MLDNLKTISLVYFGLLAVDLLILVILVVLTIKSLRLWQLNKTFIIVTLLLLIFTVMTFIFAYLY